MLMIPRASIESKKNPPVMHAAFALGRTGPDDRFDRAENATGWMLRMAEWDQTEDEAVKSSTDDG